MGSYQQAPQLDCLYPAAPQALSGCTVHKDAAIQLALDASHATFMPLPRNTPRQSRHPDLGQITGRSQAEAWCAGANGHTRPTWVVPAAARSLMPSGSMPVSSSRRMCSIQQRTSLKKERVMPTEPQIRSLHAGMTTARSAWPRPVSTGYKFFLWSTGPQQQRIGAEREDNPGELPLRFSSPQCSAPCMRWCIALQTRHIAGKHGTANRHGSASVLTCCMS